MSEHTKAPWEWRKVGKDWVLWGAHGIRPIVLDGKKLRVRNDDCLMVPFDPDHPDARLIESAPALLAACKAILPYLSTETEVLDDAAMNEGRASGYGSASLKLRAAIALAEPREEVRNA